MNRELIQGGYILLSRKLLENGIMEKPPLYHKLWIWMLMQASFKDHGNLKRGQFFTSLERMRDAMAYKVGCCTRKPTKKEIRGVIDFLSKGTAIVTTKVTHGMIITILNYDYYQDVKNYEGHSEGHSAGQGKGTILRKKGRKKEKPSTMPQKNLEKPKPKNPGTSKKPKPEAKTQNSMAATKIYEFYIKEISPGSKDKRRAHVNIEKYLKSYDPDDLITAIKNYKTVSKNNDPQYRKDPANFFGTKKGNEYFMNYLEGEFKQVSDADKPVNQQEWF